MPLEQQICRCVARSLENVHVGSAADLPSDAIVELSSCLEIYLPSLLQVVHAEWKGESLDGVYPTGLIRLGSRSIDLWGMCMLITDQSLTPFRVQLQIATDQEAITWLELWLGERGSGKLGVRRYGSRGWKIGYLLGERLSSINWIYHIGFGERQYG